MLAGAAGAGAVGRLGARRRQPPRLAELVKLGQALGVESADQGEADAGDLAEPDAGGGEGLLELGEELLDGEAEEQAPRLLLVGQRRHLGGADAQLVDAEGHQAASASSAAPRRAPRRPSAARRSR